MKNRLIASLLLAGMLLFPVFASAAPIRAFVAPFTVTPQEAAGLKETLQRLLSSRLNGDGITTVDSAADADIVVSGIYARIGKMFSLDAAAKLSSGETVASAFVQGDSQDDLIPALGTVAFKLKGETVQRYPQAAAAQATRAVVAKPVQAAVPVPAQEAPVPLPPRAVQEPAAQRTTAAQPTGQPLPAGSTVWLSERIKGALSSLAPAGTIDGARVLFVSDRNKLRVYRQEKTLTLLAEAEIPLHEKVVAVDSTGKEGADGLRAYVTSFDGDTPSSRIYSYRGGALKLVAEKLPYMFRAAALSGGAAKVYAQQIGRIDTFYGDVYEVSDTASGVELKNPIKMPQYGNIFNFNLFSDAAGKTYYTVFSSEGYLIVYSQSGEELWRSNDKYGGSASYFKRAFQPTGRVDDEEVKWQFLDQRITVTDKGEVIVPQNDGFFVLGNQRSYSKYSIACLTWNGSYLEEKWKTKVTPSYLADYFFAPGSRELVLLEVPQKEGIFGKGASAIRVVRAD